MYDAIREQDKEFMTARRRRFIDWPTTIPVQKYLRRGSGTDYIDVARRAPIADGSIAGPRQRRPPDREQFVVLDIDGSNCPPTSSSTPPDTAR